LRVFGEHQIALEPRDVEILIAGRDDEERIHIGGNELKLSPGTGGAALEQALAGEEALDALVRRIEEQPVADSGRGLIVFGIAGEGWDARSNFAPVTMRRSRWTAITRTGVAVPSGSS
jgi:hypothetical protein